ncbi:MAG: class I SAM-dependent methyltransferase [Anaerolineae bacterium]|nr:class I SAM-dependent methyltransferase [Anaerolineae bacterium]
MKEKIVLSKAQETLLIPLFSKAGKNPVLDDIKANQILSQVSYDFSSLKVPQKTQITLCLRAKQLDRFTALFLEKHPNAIILHLGCGLDSRCLRLDHDKALWFDLDMPDVIELRRKFFSENENYRMIASSVTDLEWIRQIPDEDRPVLVLAEGLLMYLHEEEVKGLFLALNHRFSNCSIIFDVFSLYTVSRIQSHPSLQKTGAEIYWGLDDPHQIENWKPGFTLLEEWFFSQSPDIKNLNWFYRLMFRLTASIKMARNAQRLLYYRL